MVDDGDDGWNSDDPGAGSCARCGCNLDDYDSVDLCDQCEWESHVADMILFSPMISEETQWP